MIHLGYDFYAAPITNEILSIENNLILMFKKHTSAIIDGVINDDYNPFLDQRLHLKKSYGYYIKNKEIRISEISKYLDKINSKNNPYKHLFQNYINKLNLELEKLFNN